MSVEGVEKCSGEVKGDVWGKVREMWGCKKVSGEV